MEIISLITGVVTAIAGVFFLALTFFGWDEVTLFLEPNEERNMKIMLFFVAIIGTVFLISGADTLFNLIG